MSDYFEVITDASTGETTTRPYTAEEIAVAQAAAQTAAQETARAQRNSLLAQSDWTQVADAPVDKAAWATYRQALRDITEQGGFPKVINWPTTPN